MHTQTARGTEWTSKAQPSGGWAHFVVMAIARRKSRNALKMLDDRILADIGLTRQMAADEAAKPIWRD